MAKLAQVLEVSVDYLLGLEQIEKPQIVYYGEVFSKEFTWKDLAAIP